MKVAAAILAVVGLVSTSEAAFTDRVATDLKALYTFEQQECADNAFTDKAGTNVLGGMSYNSAYAPESSGGKNKCPIVVKGGHTYQRAHNGVSFSGLRQGSGLSYPDYEFVESQSDISGLGLTNQITIEMWIRPTGLDGLDKNYVLFEISGAELTNSGGNWQCGALPESVHFAAQLVYNQGVFKLQYRAAAGQPCPTATFGRAIQNDKVYHVTLAGIEFTDSFSGDLKTGWSFRINEADTTFVGTPVRDSDDPIGVWNTSHTVKLGSNPFALSQINNAGVGGFYSFPGDVLMFALYNRELTEAEIETNFDAGLPNSAPAVPQEGMTYLNAEEDAETMLDMSDLVVYDFDSEYFGKPTTFQYFFETNVTDGSEAGNVDGQFRFNPQESQFNMPPWEFNKDSLYFFPRAKDAYGGPAVVEVSAVDAEGAKSLLFGASKTFVAATNDLPKPNPPNPSVDVPQTRSVEVVLSAMDVDCSIAQDFAQQSNLEPAQQSSCELFGLDKFRIETAPMYGKLYEPDVDGKCIAFQPASEVTFPYEFTISYPAPLDNTVLGTKSKKLCYEGCLTDSPTNPCPVNTTQSADGIVAVENVTYVVFDKANAEVAQDITVTVTSVLTTGLEEKVHYIIDEDVDFYKFELQGVDNFCNTPDGELLPEAELPAICADRQKRFALKELPPAYQGELYLAPNNESVVTPEMLAAEGQRGLLLDVDVNNQTFIYFKPAPGYFNQDRWPLCNSGTGGFTRCPSSDRKAADVNDFKCTGPELADNPRTCLQLASGATPSTELVFYTVQDLEGAIMGQCGATRPSALVPGNDKYLSEGCPVNIVYSLDVNGLQSQAKTGNKIWVTNMHDAAELVMPLEVIEDVQEGKKIPLKNKDGECVRIDTLGEGDIRVLELKIEVALTRGQIQVDPELAELTVDKVEYIIGGGSRATGASDFRLVGTAKQLNEELCAMSYIADRTFESADLKFELFDVSDTRKKPTFGEGNKVESVSRDGVIKLKFKQETITDKALNVTAIVTWSSISAAVLLILGACYCCIHAIFRRALAGERAAVWFVRNILFTHIDPHDEHALDHEKGVDEAARSFEEAIHAEKVNMERVRCCARLLATICPCCCKFDPNAGHDLPSEEEMQVAALRKINEKIASKHVPSLEERNKSLRLEVAEDEIFDWEVHQHVDEKTGKVTNYYYNSRTGASSWTKPSVKVRRPIDENILTVEDELHLTEPLLASE